MQTERPAGGTTELTDLEVRLRRDARRCLDTALRAVDPERLVTDALREEVLAAGSSVLLVAVGKAAAAMARGARAVIGERVAQGIVLAPRGATPPAPPPLQTFHGGHPVPDEAGVAGAQAVLDLVRGAGRSDQILLLLSGGGSALMTLPPDDITLHDVRTVTAQLLAAGAPIEDLNCVRKHLDRLKGGQLAREAAPAHVLALVLSDVVGDPLDVIASGPVSPDPTTFADAINVLERYRVWASAPPAVRDHLEAGRAGDVPETPKRGERPFARVRARLVGRGRTAAAAALAEAAVLGYETHLLSDSLTGEAREVGRSLAEIGRRVRDSGVPLPPPACLAAAGETVVTVRGDGVGGRNQELALAAALALENVDGVIVASMGTDGIDGPTDAAGALATWTTLARARRAGLDPRAALDRNDSYPFFRALGDLIVTGPTGTNVMDLQLVLVAGSLRTGS
ncbi:MAG: DUF4147 domain-containing protein [Gemmatimonadetes bacterium]|nr:DUF4147 domain-containing protein [Gemmatimonadota bacterium]